MSEHLDSTMVRSIAAVQALVSASTIGTQPHMSDAQLADAVKAELGAWFGADETAAWQLLRIYRIPFAQPDQVCTLTLKCYTPQELTTLLFLYRDHLGSAIAFDTCILQTLWNNSWTRVHVRLASL